MSKLPKAVDVITGVELIRHSVSGLREHATRGLDLLAASVMAGSDALIHRRFSLGAPPRAGQILAPSGPTCVVPETGRLDTPTAAESSLRAGNPRETGIRLLMQLLSPRRGGAGGSRRRCRRKHPRYGVLTAATGRLVCLLAAAVALGSCGGPAQPTESDVAATIKHLSQVRFDSHPGEFAPRGTTVRSVHCAKTADKTYACVAELSTGLSYPVTAHITEDGKSIVTG